MPLYHIYIAYTDKNGKQTDCFYFNFTKEAVEQALTTPYIKNRPILVDGKFVHPSDIVKISIFESAEVFKDLILPDGKSPIDTESNAYIERCFSLRRVKGFVRYCTHEFMTSPPQARVEPTISLMDSASFLGLNANWSLATCALQLQEVAVTLVAKRKKIKLDKANVERLLNRKIEEPSFNHRYEAFSRQVKDSFNVEMPILTTHLRKMRTKVLHEGYNPKPEETEPIVSFTIGLLKKLKDIS